MGNAEFDAVGTYLPNGASIDLTLELRSCEEPVGKKIRRRKACGSVDGIGSKAALRI